MLLTAEGCVKITDFGVAEELSPYVLPSDGVFSTGGRYSQDDTCHVSAGSPAFQAPELAAGAETFSGFAVDVWASGVTLWNMATGGYPFEGDTLFTLYAAISKVPYRVRF